MNRLLPYSLLAGLAVSCWTMLEFMLGFHSSHKQFGGIMDLGSVVLLVFIFAEALKQYRTRLERKRKSFTFISGTLYGLRLSLFTAVIITAFMVFYSYSINPAWKSIGYQTDKARLALGGPAAAANSDTMQISNIMYNPALATAAIFAASFLTASLIVMVESRLLIRRNRIGG